MMSRIEFSLAVCALLSCAGIGCANFIEARAIEQFSEALARNDLDGLKSSTSDEFERKALRLDESLDDLKILRLPEEETSIVKVEDVSDHQKKVDVQVGESKRLLRYELTRDADSKKWVVNDIRMNQKRKGMTVAKSVTEQMDLLLTVREFLAAWKDGGRADVLGNTTPEFGSQLSELPPGYLARLTRQVVGDRAPQSKFRPEAQMDRDEAIVTIPRTTGKMVISLKLQGGSWKVDDVAVESKADGEEITSVRKTALVMTTAVAFLEAYNANDKQAVSRLCTDKFQECLMAANFAAVRLPSPAVPHGEYRVKYHKTHPTFTIPGAANLVNISLVRHEDESQPEKQPKYLVEEVTIYDPDGRQEKRLSALFTANVVMRLFADALAGSDLPMLRQLSTPDFNRRVWQRLDEKLLAELPLGGVGNVVPNVSAVEYRGAVTRMTVEQGPLTLTYVLRNWNGKLRVDDVLVPVPKCPNSLKTVLELMIPIRKFAAGIREPNIDLLGRNSSIDFNRLVWKQTERVPDVGVTVPARLQMPLASVALRAGKATVKLGSENSGAHVELLEENERWVVDEVLLIAGVEPALRRKLKKTLRTELADNFKARRRPLPPRSSLPAEQPADVYSPRRPAIESSRLPRSEIIDHSLDAILQPQPKG